MKLLTTGLATSLLSALALSVILGLGSGCSKKEEATAAQSTPSQPGPAPEVKSPAAPAPAPATASVDATTDPKAALEAANAALRARQYEAAAKTLLTVQRQKTLTEQQAQTARDQMIKLQSELAAALASGDPKAKAAADLLRASSMH